MILTDEVAQALVTALAAPDGGFTIDPTGRPVTDGYAVAIHPERSYTVPVDAVTADDLRRYAVRFGDLLAVPGTTFGGWHDPGSGTVWLDISWITHDLDEALATARQHDQIAIFDVRSGASIEAGGTGGGQRS
jgi:hypothetical protein